MKTAAWLLICWALVCAPGWCAAPETLPPQLEVWKNWVLHNLEERLCPADCGDPGQTRCQWPTPLRLEVGAGGAKFEQTWRVFAPGWVMLPGQKGQWPVSVAVDGQPAVVVKRDQTPAAWMPPGQHLVTGRFVWPHRPEILPLPEGVGLVQVVLDGRELSAPWIDARNRLWLEERQPFQGGQGQTRVKVFRLFKDLVPMQVTTVFQVAAAGEKRDFILEGALPDGSTAMAIDSPLPARLDAEGRLVVQLRAGQWHIEVVARMNGPQFKIEALRTPHGDEVWSFEPQEALRMVDLSGVPAVEPGQTDMPRQWYAFPAFRVRQGEFLELKEIRRGDPDPVPDALTLERTWWLDFDGSGFSVQDRVGGTISRQWYLAMEPPMQLGRVALDGRDQLITAQGDQGKPGVQLRGGRLDLLADARWPRRSSVMPVAGWDQDFQQVYGRVHLPPGWQLIGALGVDQVSSSWVQRWSLLDLFLALVIGLTFFKLRGRWWGLLALIVMALTFHEPGAPVLVWLHLLAVLAMVPLLSSGWIRRCVVLWGAGALVVLLVAAVPFMVNQVRWGLYPQLLPSGSDTREVSSRAASVAAVRLAEKTLQNLPRIGSGAPHKAPFSDRMDLRVEEDQPDTLDRQISPVDTPVAATQLDQPDPDALIPTGPGLPLWKWQVVALGWSGPVARTQTMRLFLLPPWVGLLLAVVRVVLLAWLIGGVFLWQSWWGKLTERMGVQMAVALLVGCFCLAGPSPVSAAGGDFPPPEMLEELRQRLLEPPACTPNCAEIAWMEVQLVQDRLQIRLEVHAACRTAVPLPVDQESWAPGQILLDNVASVGLVRDTKGQLWGLLDAGVHSLVLLGEVGLQNHVNIPLPLKPHAASVRAEGWNVGGVAADGSLGSAVRLERIQVQAEQTSGEAAVAEKALVLPPFFAVERTLRLGSTWQVETRVKRLTPVGSSVAVNIPLLQGQSVTTPDIMVAQGAALVTLAPHQQIAVFDAVLPVTPVVELFAAQDVPWSESWSLEASPTWQCDIDGIAPIHHQDASGAWRPQWRPWPGERVTIRISRPLVVGGQIKTIDEAKLVLNPGRHFGTGELALSIRSSRGGSHSLALPALAELQLVRIDGKSLPVRAEDGQVTLPLSPGAHKVRVDWQWPGALGALFQGPEIQLGQEAVNALVTVNLPVDRWVLMVGGPRWGPAVLLWSYLAVIVLFAVGLGRIGVTPLKTAQWLLLGLGLTQVPALYALIIAGWLVVLGVKGRRPAPAHWLPFNTMQAGIVVLSFAALFCLFAAVKAGLIGQPLMQIFGNDSSYQSLHWTQDRITETMPRPWVVSLPLWVYRGLMLAWALWLALALLRWLKWGWSCFAREGVWRKSGFKLKKNRVERSVSEKENR